MHYYRARYYDPGRGRFVSEDPIGLISGVNLYVYVDGSPLTGTDPYGLLNPAKVAVALGNSAIAGWTGAAGYTKLAVAAGVSPAAATGVGALPPAVLAAWGLWNLKSSMAAWERAQQQWSEALCEDWSQASWKNLWGIAPGGTHYDDPGEYSGPVDYIQNRSWWKFLQEAGYF